MDAASAKSRTRRRRPDDLPGTASCHGGRSELGRTPRRTHGGKHSEARRAAAGSPLAENRKSWSATGKTDLTRVNSRRFFRQALSHARMETSSALRGPSIVTRAVRTSNLFKSITGQPERFTPCGDPEFFLRQFGARLCSHKGGGLRRGRRLGWAWRIAGKENSPIVFVACPGNGYQQGLRIVGPQKLRRRDFRAAPPFKTG